MNYNNYPTTNSPESQPSQAELEYRQKLTEEILADSLGTVGLYTTTDLNPEQLRSLGQKIAERNPQGAENQVAGARGWGDWGERKIGARVGDIPNRNLLSIDTTQHENDEEAAFVTLPDDTVEVRYYFHTARGYKDGAGRPGNSLNVSFILSPEKAAELDQAVEADPSFMAAVVEAQVLSVGIPKEIWTGQLRPRVGFNLLTGVKDHALAITHATVDGEQTATLRPYADKRPILPQVESVTEIPATTESTPYSFDEYYETFTAINNRTIQNEKNRHVTLPQIIEMFQAELEELCNDPALATPDSPDYIHSLAMAHAHADTVDALQHELAQQAVIEQQQQDVAQAQSEIDQVFTTSPSETLATTASDAPEYTDGSTVQYKDSSHTIDSSYTLADGRQMLVLRDSLGQEKHVMADKLSQQ
jgi:hypothetical protein